MGAPPRGLAAAAEEDIIRLFWTPGPEPDLAGYLVYRRAAGEGVPGQAGNRDLQAAIAKAVTLAPQNVAAQQSLARIALRQGNFGEALHAIATALTYDVEGDSQDSLIALQTETLAKIAKRELDTLTAATNPFRALDKLPES